MKLIERGSRRVILFPQYLSLPFCDRCFANPELLLKLGLSSWRSLFRIGFQPSFEFNPHRPKPPSIAKYSEFLYFGVIPRLFESFQNAFAKREIRLHHLRARVFRS